jgi:hypothetical protein
MESSASSESEADTSAAEVGKMQPCSAASAALVRFGRGRGVRGSSAAGVGLRGEGPVGMVSCPGRVWKELSNVRQELQVRAPVQSR